MSLHLLLILFDSFTYFLKSRGHDQHIKNVFDNPGYEVGNFFKPMRLRDTLNPTLGLDDRVWDRPNLTSLNGQLRNENSCEHGEPMYFWAVQGMYSPNLPAAECPDHYQQQIMSFKKYISFANFWTNEISFRHKYSFVVGWETWGGITRTPLELPSRKRKPTDGTESKHR